MRVAPSTGHYQSIPDMTQLPASWKRFHVFLGGTTNGAHADLVASIKAAGHTEVGSSEECDFCLAFCPVVSRLGADVDSTLRRIPAETPTVLVLMYNTYSADYVVPEAERLVENPNVRLIVSCLFYQGAMLQCRRNEIALYEVQKFLGFPQVRGSTGIWDYIEKNWKIVAGVMVVILVLIMVIVIVTQVNKQQ